MGSYSDIDPREIIEHFGLKPEDLEGCAVITPLNKQSVRDRVGITVSESSFDTKKARIIVDYDADFDFILMRVISL